MTSSGGEAAETVIVSAIVVAYALLFAVIRLRRSRVGFNVALPLTVGFVIRMAAIAGISLTGLSATLRGGDEITFLDLAKYVATTPFGTGFWPHGPYQLHTELFALQLKLVHSSVGALRIVQVGIAMLGMILILAAVYDLADGRAARLAAWLLVLEPASIFFNSALHKEPLMELAGGLVVYGGTRIWLRLDVRGILICALGGLIGIETRSYAGWFLVSAAVLVLLHAALRGLNRPLRAMPLIYGVAIIGFVATPVLIQASSSKSLQQLQVSQNANTSGGSGSSANGNNLALEKVDLSTRGAILSNLPTRIRDVMLRPYPWQLGDSSQRFGAVGTLFAYAILVLLARYAWLSRGRVLPSAAPLLYPLLFLLVAYALSAGNAGTGFRYRTHLVTLLVSALAILRERVLLAREAGTEPSRRSLSQDGPRLGGRIVSPI